MAPFPSLGPSEILEYSPHREPLPSDLTAPPFLGLATLWSQTGCWPFRPPILCCPPSIWLALTPVIFFFLSQLSFSLSDSSLDVPLYLICLACNWFWLTVEPGWFGVSSQSPLPLFLSADIELDMWPASHLLVYCLLLQRSCLTLSRMAQTRGDPGSPA